MEGSAEGCTDRVLVGEAREGCAVADFRRLWDARRGQKAPWESNPWVQVVEFKVLQGGRVLANPPSFIPGMGAAVPGGCPYCSKGPGAEHERDCRFKGHVPPLGGQK